MDRDNLILFLLEFYCKSNNIIDKYQEIVSDLKKQNIIENDSNDSIIPAFLVNQPNRILFPDNFVLQEQIGKGSFGNILKVYNKLDSQFYALKIIENDEKLEEDKFLREIRLLAFLDHPNIVRYHTSWSESNKLFYIMELCDFTLTSFINSRECVDDGVNKHMVKQIITGVKYIHSKGVLHRDLTTNNILIKDNVVKIADFGLSIKKDNPKQITMGSDEYGTISYLAPECLELNQYSVYTDYYAVGIILFLLYSQFSTDMEKYKSLEKLREKQLCTEIIKEKYKDIEKMILALIDLDPESRKISFIN